MKRTGRHCCNGFTHSALGLHRRPKQGQDNAIDPWLQFLCEFDRSKENDTVSEYHEEEDAQVPPFAPAYCHLQDICEHLLPCDARPSFDVILKCEPFEVILSHPLQAFVKCHD